MRKFISGAVFGLILSTTLTAFAASPLIGKQVKEIFPLKIDGIRSPKDVVAIDGTSYLPVRVAAEQFGYYVSFVNREVILIKREHVKAQEHSVQSNVFKVGGGNSEQAYITRGGEGYLPIVVFAHYAEFDGVKATVSVPGYDPIIVRDKQEYIAGTNGFTESGRVFIKLSALGLKANIQGDTLWLEKL